jgi:quercetin dioxygenase-like cupin family protein
MKVTLDGWDIVHAQDAAWGPWGSRGDARAKVIGSGDGYTAMLVEAQAGYRGDPHEHTNAEFFYLVDGSIRNQGVEMKAGDGYIAAAGSTHADFEAHTDSTYVVIFKL